MKSDLLLRFERALKTRNPVLHDRLQRGLAEDRIRTMLEKAGVTGNVQPILEIYSWKNGSRLDPSVTQEQASPFPASVYLFMDFKYTLVSFQGFEECAAYHPRFNNIVGRYFPLFWDGSTDYMAVDLKSETGRVVILITQSERAVFEAYASFDSFLEDAIRANEQNEELTCLSERLRPSLAIRYCTFCREPLSNVDRMIESQHGAAICNRCVALCYDAMRAAGADLTTPGEPSVRLDWVSAK
jgi:hypothetical protein